MSGSRSIQADSLITMMSWSEAEGESDSGVDIELGDIHDVEEQ